jgi:hypothetical protein
MTKIYVMVKVCIALTVGFLWPFKTHAQKCDCEKNHKRLFEDPADAAWRYGMYWGDKQLGGHPYSTFSKTHPGSYIEGNNDFNWRSAVPSCLIRS